MIQEFLDFIQRSYFVFAYGITLVLSLIAYPKYFDTHFKYLPAIIAYTLFNELLGYFIRYYPDFSFFSNVKYTWVNEIIYNIFDLVFFSFFYYAYWKLVENTGYKKLIRKVGIAVMLTFPLSCIFQNPVDTTLYYANALASWTLLFFIFLYFKDKHNNQVSLIQPYNLVFWISTGLIIFHLTAPFLFLIGYLNYPIWLDYNLKTLLHIIIIIMYASFCIGFIISRKKSFG